MAFLYLSCEMREGVGLWMVFGLVVTLWFGMQPLWEPQYMKHEKAELFGSNQHPFVYSALYSCVEPSLKTGR